MSDDLREILRQVKGQKQAITITIPIKHAAMILTMAKRFRRECVAYLESEIPRPNSGALSVDILKQMSEAIEAFEKEYYKSD